MYRYNWNMDPRGRNTGHKGFRPGIFLGIVGLLFFGWIFIAALCGVAGAAIMILASVISGLASVISEAAYFLPLLIRALVSSRGFAIGIALGLVWYFRTHRRNRAAAAESRESTGRVDGTAVETEITEAPAYRTFNA